MLAFKYVPVVKITLFEEIILPSSRIIPFTMLSSTFKFSTIASLISRLSVLSKYSIITLGYTFLSAWARNALTAGPLELFNIFI